ncbi:MAG TPA: hypothetical protein VJO54_11970 [Burkholderiales bacterium]|nr:hypothetical protein [Burkholderiales bacterium]
MKKLAAIGAVLAMLAAAECVRAQGTGAESAPGRDNNVTVYGGYRFSGGFTDVNTGKSWELSEGPSFALAADFGIDRKTQWEVFYSYRNSALRASGFAPAQNDIGLGVTYLHVGGTYFVDQIGRGAYVVGGLGLTNLAPHQSGLGSETKFSLNLGFGYMIPLGERLGIKLEGRGYATLVNSSGGLFCSGGCVISIKGSTLSQGELLAGITARF